MLKILEDDHGWDVKSWLTRVIGSKPWRTAVGQLEEFARTIEKRLRRSEVPTAILLSGGGNDIAGDELGMLINHASSARPVSTPTSFAASSKTASGMPTSQSSQRSPSCAASNRQYHSIIMHGYDRPVPDGRGFAGGWGPLPGP